MRRIMVHREGYKVEVEVSDLELSQILGVPLQLTEPKDEVYGRTRKTATWVSTRLKHCELLFETRTEMRGKTDEQQARYLLYRDKETSELFGIVISNDRKYNVNMGNPTDSNSTISLITKAINSIPIERPFSKNQIQRILPEKEGKGNKMKFGFDYLELITKLIQKVKGKDFGTNSNLYKRIRVMGETSGENVVQSQPEATLNTTT